MGHLSDDGQDQPVDRAVDTGVIDVQDLERSLRRAVTRALAEDLDVAGDLTTQATMTPLAWVEAEIVARQAGVVAGVAAVIETYAQVDDRVRVDVFAPDGADVVPNEVIAVVTGPVRSVLSGERTALNFLGHLSGIATATNHLVQLVAGTGVAIRDTRKTTPGLRLLEKAAVSAGGGHNHRIGLFDALLLKDNHVAACGSVTEAVQRAKALAGDRVVQVEVTSLDELEEAIQAGADDILLDNFPVPLVAEAVEVTAGRARLEASGNLRAETVADYARALGPGGRLAIGAVTHSAPNLDTALDVVRTQDGPIAADERPDAQPVPVEAQGLPPEPQVSEPAEPAEPQVSEPTAPREAALTQPEDAQGQPEFPADRVADESAFAWRRWQFRQRPAVAGEQAPLGGED